MYGLDRESPAFSTAITRVYAVVVRTVSVDDDLCTFDGYFLHIHRDTGTWGPKIAALSTANTRVYAGIVGADVDGYFCLSFSLSVSGIRELHRRQWY